MWSKEGNILPNSENKRLVVINSHSKVTKEFTAILESLYFMIYSFIQMNFIILVISPNFIKITLKEWFFSQKSRRSPYASEEEQDDCRKCSPWVSDQCCVYGTLHKNLFQGSYVTKHEHNKWRSRDKFYFTSKISIFRDDLLQAKTQKGKRGRRLNLF